MTDYDDEARSVFGDPEYVAERFRRLDDLDRVDALAADIGEAVDAAGDPFSAALMMLAKSVAALCRQVETLEVRLAELEAER
jgi:ubiquinone biosynthesis protein UbiJ